MVAGASFPDLLDWTWGEIVEFICCKEEAKRDELRIRANMDFKHVMLTMKALSAKKGARFSVMEEYDFLWSREERDKAAMEAFERQMMAMCSNVDKE